MLLMLMLLGSRSNSGFLYLFVIRVLYIDEVEWVVVDMIVDGLDWDDDSVQCWL